MEARSSTKTVKTAVYIENGIKESAQYKRGQVKLSYQRASLA